MLYFPERIARGDVPNVDFLHLYGPGSLHVLTGWYELFGYSLPAERTFGLLQHLGIIFGLFALARAWGRAAATAVGVFAVFYVMTPVALTAMAWNGGLALTLWSAVFALRASRLGGVGQGRNWWIAAGVAGRAGAELPPGPRHRRRPRVRLAAVAKPSGPPSGPPRRRHRLAADLGPPDHGRPGQCVRRHGPRPGVPAPRRPGAAPPAAMGPPRRCVAGGGRGDPAVVEVPACRRRTRSSCGSSSCCSERQPWWPSPSGTGAASGRPAGRPCCSPCRWSASGSFRRRCNDRTPRTSCGSRAWRSRSRSPPSRNSSPGSGQPSIAVAPSPSAEPSRSSSRSR